MLRKLFVAVVLLVPLSAAGQDLGATFTDLAADLEALQSELNQIQLEEIKDARSQMGFTIAATGMSVPVYSGAANESEKIFEAK